MRQAQLPVQLIRFGQDRRQFFFAILTALLTVGSISKLEAAPQPAPKAKPVKILSSISYAELEKSDRALENLRAIEASQMVYNLYESFIVPQICRDTATTKGGQKKKACRLLPYVKATDFGPPDRTTGIIYKPATKLTHVFNFKFTGATPNLVPVAPKKYHVTSVACYRTEIKRGKPVDCSLFFAVLESPTLPTIIAIKGTSNREDWSHNLAAGAPIMKEAVTIFTKVFTSLLSEVKSAVVGDDEDKIPDGLRSLAPALTKYFSALAKRVPRIIVTGHSLGGALAQELGRQIYFVTRTRAAGVGPTINIFTFNGLSYTSMLGRLGKGDRAGGILRNNLRDFDGQFLTAINFHTADDALTQLVNYSFIGRLLRAKEQRGIVQAGGDILLPTARGLELGSLNAKITGHGTITLLKDTLFTVGGKRVGNKFVVQTLAAQKAQLDKMASANLAMAENRNTREYFDRNGIDTEEYHKDGTPNYDRNQVWRDMEKDKKRAEQYLRMSYYLQINERHFGRLIPGRDYTDDLHLELYEDEERWHHPSPEPPINEKTPNEKVLDYILT